MGRKKKISGDLKQKIRGVFLVTIIDEAKESTFLPGVDWNYIIELSKNPKVKIEQVETIATEFHRPKDVTEMTLKKLAEVE